MVGDTKETIRLLIETFGSRPDVYALAAFDGTNVTYRPIEEQWDAKEVLAHLEGEICMGAYALAKDDTVRWLGWDVDSGEDRNVQAEQEAVTAIATILGDMPHAIEFSGGKGYHVLLFLEKPVSAIEAKSFAEWVRDKAGVPRTSKRVHCEPYPKQARLTASNPFGNLLKMPLGVHPRTHERSRFVDTDNGWESGPELDPVEILNHRISPEALVLRKEQAYTPNSELAKLLAPHWTEGARHDLSLALAGWLCQVGWVSESVEELIRKVCELSGDADAENRIKCVRDTFKRVLEGKSVAGYSKLSELLPLGILRAMTDASTRGTATPTLRQIDAIRLSNTPPHLKIRSGAANILADVRDRGYFIKTTSEGILDRIWFFDRATALVTEVVQRLGDSAGLTFFRRLKKEYGINTAEAYGVQVYRALFLEAVHGAQVVKIYRRTHWDGAVLWISRGGSVLYRLDGETITTVPNGTNGLLFETGGGFPEMDLATLDQPSDSALWRNTTDGLSFRSSAEVNATPGQQQQMLRAWILATFFQELSPTRPILMCIGDPGSGKTTAMRRVLKVLEGPDAEVLELASDKQDSLRATLTNHHLAVLDNLENTSPGWLVDMLNRVATGSAIELRQLYQTNAVTRFRPECWVAVTAVTLPFKDEALYDRILPLQFQRLESWIPESKLQSNLVERYTAVWADLLRILNRIVAAIGRGLLQEEPQHSRLADFGNFCALLGRAEILPSEDLRGGMRGLEHQQQFTLADNSPLLDVMDFWFSNDPEAAGKAYTSNDLLTTLRPLAKANGLVWRWDSSQGLSRHIEAIKGVLHSRYGYSSEDKWDKDHGRNLQIHKFNPNGS